MKRLIKSVFGFFLLGVIIAFIAQSCSSTRLVAKEPKSVFIFVPVFMRDTVKKDLTDAQKQLMIDKFYDYGYKKYYGPQFESLRTIINLQSESLKSQAISIKQLSGTLVNMRMRSIRRNDSMNNLQINDKKEYAKLEKIYLDQQRKQVAKNASQINDLKNITDVLLVFGVLLMLGFIIVCILTWILWLKIETLSKKLSYA